MSTNIEDLVRAAQERQAARSVSPDRIRAALPARAARIARRRRVGVLATVAGTAALVAVVSVPLLTLRGGTKDPAPDADARSGPGSATVTNAPLWYRPTWLPPGFAERQRESSDGPPGPGHWVGVVRTWSDREAGPVGFDGLEPQLVISVQGAMKADDPPAGSGEPVDINGIRGYYDSRPGGGNSIVTWRADADHVVTINLSNMDLPEADLLRIARSVRPDPAQLVVPLRLGWLPRGMVPATAKVVGKSPATWHARVHAEEPLPAPAPASSSPGRATENRTPRHVSVAVAPTALAPPGGERLTVRGRPARLVAGSGKPEGWYLIVELAPDRVLTVFGGGPDAPDGAPVSRAELIRIAENVTVTDADTGWIGTP